MTAPSPGIDPILTPLVNPWRPGTTYPPGSVVRPTASPPVQNAPITNGDFETASLTDWTLGSGWSRTTSVWYQGTACMMLAPGSGSSDLVSKTTSALRRVEPRGADPQVIARLIVEALGAKRPRSRYHAGFLAGPVLWLRRILPDRVLDHLIGAQLRIKPAPRVREA